jgi:hypothetical protein
VLLFGSVARGEAGAESDLDLLVVRDARTDEDAPGWCEQLANLERDATAWSGNAARIVEYGEEDLTDAAVRDVLVEALLEGRLRKAEQFLDVAAMVRDLADDEADVGDAFVTLCIHAGIAASDVICCKALGHFVQGEDHLQAVAELSKVTPDGQRLGNDLRQLLQMKNRAGYAAPPVNAGQRKRAWRRAESLVEAARQRS